MNNMEQEQFDTDVTPDGVGGSWAFAGLWRYRDLVKLLVRRNFVVNYKQTILGPLWTFIRPLLTTIVFTVVFGKLAKLPTDGVPPFLYYMCGNIIWNYFSNSVTSMSEILQGNAHLLSKIYFPRLVLPFAGMCSRLINYFLQMVIFLGFMLYFHFRNGIGLGTGQLLFFPLLLLQASMLAMGVGLFISAVTIRYRDLNMLVGFGLQLWMYVTPVAYSVSLVPEKYRTLYSLNPMTSVMVFYRQMFFGGDGLNWGHWGISLAVTLVVFLAGIWNFHRVEKNFIDTI